MGFDSNYPIYLGLSKTAFSELRLHGRLHNVSKTKFTDLMSIAEENAKKEAKKVGDEKGVVVKFNTVELYKHPVFFGNLFDDVIERIFQFIVGFYEVEVIVIVVDNGVEYC
jgi:hypothetical protein